MKFQVREDVKIGFIVGSIATSDNLENENVIPGSTGGHITYTLNSLTPENQIDAFDIDRNTGSLVVARELDRETQSEYRLEVRALDTSAMNNPQSSAVTVRVDIGDANDNPPRWAHDPITITLSESTAIGTSIYNFTATDADSGSNADLRYSLIKQYPGAGSFTLDPLTGTLVLGAYLDFESIQEYTIIVKATDQSLNVTERLGSSVTCRIIIEDSNDNVPKFVIPSSSVVYFSDMITVGMLVTHVVAVDSDSGDNGRVTYVISSGNEGNHFALGYDNGIITLAKPLSPDGNKVFTINITASDNGTPTRQSHMVLKLSLQNSAGNSPRFSNSMYYASISEDANVGTSVIKVSAKMTFLEGGGNITFNIPSGIAENHFKIDSQTGLIATAAKLDREQREKYIIPIYVSDEHFGQKITKRTQFDVATLHVTVTDVNDHAPEFRLGSCYPLNIPENNDFAVVHTMVASDLDSGKNGQIVYSVTGGNIGNKFSINSANGELTARPLDRETHSKYLLTVTAQDKGQPQLQGSCNVSIRVEDLNDNDPKFNSSTYTATILEDVPVDTSVLKVHASDVDIGVNSRIIYSLANESEWLFRIDNKTGVITTAGYVFNKAP